MVQFFPGEAIGYCRGGQEYILKVTHWAGTTPTAASRSVNPKASTGSTRIL